ncbi:MAG TPA: anti-sigma factor [Acidimicrobiales bacterium]|nr:anti-sigma factor [Acidimicrobiales bacterium]
MELTHHEIEELLGAYALDAVSPEEAGAVGLHLRHCPRCRTEVAEHRETAAALAYAGSPAPPQLWRRIAADLAAEDAAPPPALDLARVVSRTEMDERRRRRPPRSLPLPVAAAMAAVAAAVIAVLGVQVSHLDDRTERLAGALERQGLDQAAQAALLDQSARRIDLRSEDGAVFAEAVVRDNGDGFIVRDNLPGLGPDRTYQVWAIVGDRPVSVGVLGNDPGVAAFTMSAPGVDVLAVTAEPAGGVAVPTSDPVVSGALPVN